MQLNIVFFPGTECFKREFIRTYTMCIIPVKPFNSHGSDNVSLNDAVTALGILHESGTES